MAKEVGANAANRLKVNPHLPPSKQAIAANLSTASTLKQNPPLLISPTNNQVFFTFSVFRYLLIKIELFMLRF